MNMKPNKPKPKNVRAIRLSDIMWHEIQEAAAKKEMRPSEFMRRIIEDYLLINGKSI
jgi:hypothetical protein